jgi:hypothetical protein
MLTKYSEVEKLRKKRDELFSMLLTFLIVFMGTIVIINDLFGG